MAGVFEHLAAFDDSERVAARQAVAVARKRVETQFGPFLANAAAGDHAARLALIEDDINTVVASVVAEYGGDYDKIRKVIADWATIPRDTAGQWTDSEQLQEGQQDDIDSELAKAPSAVGEDAGAGVLSSHTAGHAADCECGFCKNKGKLPGSSTDGDGDGDDDDDDAVEKTAADTPEGAGGAVKREDLPKADASGLGGPSPKIDKGKSGDQNGWNLKPIDTETKGTPHPTVDQDVTQKPEFDKDDFLDQTDSVTNSVELDTADDWGAGFASGGEEHGPNTDTWTESQNDPVTSDRGEGVLASQKTALDPVALAEGAGAAALGWKAVNPLVNMGEKLFDKGTELLGRCTHCGSKLDENGQCSKFPQQHVGSVDPDKNPISEIMSSWEDDHNNQWEDDRTVQAAIWQYDQGESSE